MKIGLFFGSFNPIHIGHLIISQYFLDYSDLKQIWFVVSPHNPLKKSDTLIDQTLRLNFVKEAVNDNSSFIVSEIEFSLPKPSYTIDTLSLFKDQYPMNQFVIIMGTDSIETIVKWKEYKRIIKENDIYLYPRLGYENTNWINTYINIKLFQAPVINISSTIIRNLITDKKSIKYLVPENVYQYYTKINNEKVLL